MRKPYKPIRFFRQLLWNRFWWQLDMWYTSGVKFTPLVFFAQDYVSPNRICRLVSMLYERGLPHECGGYDGFLWESQYARGHPLFWQCQLLPYIFLLLCGASKVPLLSANEEICPLHKRGFCTCNHFTKYAVRICKWKRIILSDLLLHMVTYLAFFDRQVEKSHVFSKKLGWRYGL